MSGSRLMFVFIILLYCFSEQYVSAEASDNFTIKGIYVSPEGKDDTADGTKIHPFYSIANAISLAEPGDTIWIRGGIYYYSEKISTPINGEEDAWITIQNYPGERPVLDFSGMPIDGNNRGIQMKRAYWKLKGLVIRRAADNGIHINGSNNTLENIITYENNDTGIQLAGGASNNIVINCDSYKNYDVANRGENADGFAAKFDIGPGNSFYGCRAWENSDDGWDLWEATGTIILENCWAFRNGINLWGVEDFEGDGNGFKLGGNYISGSHIVTRCIAFHNMHKGFDQNHNLGAQTLINNTAYSNLDRNFVVYEAPEQGQHTFINNLSYKASDNIDQGSIQITNSWNGFEVDDDDFESLDTLGVRDQRNKEWEMPALPFLHLASGSQLIDAGTDAGFEYLGSAPDLGAYEYSLDTATAANNYVENEKINELLFVQVYPNPVSDNLILSITVPRPTNITIKILDISGTIIQAISNDVWYPESQFAITYSMKSLGRGFYIVQVSADESVQNVMIIKN